MSMAQGVGGDDVCRPIGKTPAAFSFAGLTGPWERHGSPAAECPCEFLIGRVFPAGTPIRRRRRDGGSRDSQILSKSVTGPHRLRLHEDCRRRDPAVLALRGSPQAVTFPVDLPHLERESLAPHSQPGGRAC